MAYQEGSSPDSEQQAMAEQRPVGEQREKKGRGWYGGFDVTTEVATTLRYNRLEADAESSARKKSCFGIFVCVSLPVLICLGLALSFLLYDKPVSTWIPSTHKNSEMFPHLDFEQYVSSLQKLEDIAYEHGGNRAVGTIGYNSSVDFIVEELRALGLSPRREPFTFTGWVEHSKPRFSQRSENLDAAYVYGEDFLSLQYGGAGSVSSVLAVPMGDALGCSINDYANWTGGRGIAVILRGDCTFNVKILTAQAAGASAVVIYNTANGPLFSGSASGSTIPTIPALAISSALGQTLLDGLGDGRIFSISVDAELLSNARQENVLVDFPGIGSDSVIVSGSHLDSVPAGPGINDNGSGSMLNLALARTLVKLQVRPFNTIRLAWWGAEEIGLVGSLFYVRDLETNYPASLAKIKANLNFDMMSSSNGVVGCHGSAPGCTGCSVISQLFQNYFESEEIPYAFSGFSSSSDYVAFLQRGIPAGGLLSTFDPCYHLPCDTVANTNAFTLKSALKAASVVLQNLMDQTDLVSFLNQSSTDELLANRNPSQFKYEQKLEPRSPCFGARDPLI
eukprot:gb/GEZN01004461.1/.p1 GENE.gb/GEZN01004461.1/~~gb/GEZN01004461.1/.p1  ORF type:complete len:564 (-),score=62.77 gb/GEZN01004461.1/:199-1890(-)